MSQPLTVLIVEDRRDDAELLALELKRSGFDVMWDRVDTYPALDRALDSPPDLIVCDYSLPGMDPFEVLGRVRERAADVPVIVISGVVDEEVATALFPYGARDVLLKDRLARLGQTVSTALAARDLAASARRSAERERRTANLLCGLVDHAPAAICVLNQDGTPLLMNARFQELQRRGLQEAQLVRGRAAGRDRLPASSARFSSESEQIGQVRIGADHHLWLSFPVGIVEGKESATGLILLDITHQKETEQELLSARAELAAQAAELRARNNELMELDRLKTDLVNTVSHELRTPLTSILGYSELLADQAVAAPGTAPHLMVEMIGRNSRRLLNLIDNLLLLARLDGITSSALAESDPEGAIDLAEVVESIVSVIMPTAASSGLSLLTETEDDLPRVNGDRDQLEQVLMNLASNAIKFSRAPGQVTIRVRREEDDVVLEVEDTGIGMSEEELALIGTRFFRAESARIEHVPGTGLGVSVVRSIVKRHRGTLEYRSQPGKGTTATVLLPAQLPST